MVERIATFMIILYRRVDNQGCGRVTDRGPACVAVPISRRDMATYLGTTVETISRTIQFMAREGVIRIVDPRTFEIVKLDALIAISGREEFRAYGSDAPDRPPPRSDVARPHLSVLTGKSR